MSYTKKRLEDLDIMDDFLMNAVANDAEVGEAFCRTLLSTLLQRQLGKVRVLGQKMIMASTPEHRGIRMDVEVEELEDESSELPTMNIYDFEPHNYDSDKKMLAKRSRYYQAKIDSTGLKAGETDFGVLPNLYVINVLNYDPFGYDYMLYTIHNKCAEVDELEYEDGLKFLYFYTGGTKGGNEDISQMLQFMQESTSENAGNSKTKELLEYVSRVKVQPEVRRSYMRIDEIMNHIRAEGREEGRAEGRVEGRAEGRAEAQHEVYLNLVSKGVLKGKTVEQIAEELELEIAKVEELMREIEECKGEQHV